MAIIKCPECGREKVSDSAIACPECGFAVKDYIDTQKKKDELLVENLRKINEEKRRQEEVEKQAILDRKRKLESEARWKQTIIKSIESDIADYSKKIRVSVLIAVACFIFGILILALTQLDGLGEFISMISVFPFLCALGFLTAKRQTIDDLNIAQKDFDKYEKVSKQRNDNHKKEWESSHPNCPSCKGRNTYRIGTINRATSIAVFGIASSKIGKQYECKDCKYKW